MALVIYYALFGITVLFALGVLFNRNTVRSAICLVGVMAALAVNYLMMRQEFVAFIQIVVYTGAIMVLFLFVIMLLNLREPEVMPWYLRNARFWGGTLALIFFFTLALAVQVWAVSGVPGALENEAIIKESGTPEVILLSTLMITKYVAPFILTSILLLVAVIGAIVMAKRYDEDGQEIISEEEEAS